MSQAITTSSLKLSVVIPTYNRRDLLSQTLTTVFCQEFPTEEYEVVVVVDGSTDGTVEMLRSLKPKCAFHVLEQSNQGQAAARNTGINAARGELVLFLDDDILCDRTLFREHVAAHSGSGPLVVFGPVRVAPKSSRTTATAIMRERSDTRVHRLTERTEPKFPDDLFVAPNSSVPRSTLLASGGFDERFARNREDLDLGLRLWKMGVRFRFQPSAAVFHLYVKSVQALANFASTDGCIEFLLCRKHPDYRRYSPLARLAGERSWLKSLARQIAMRLPVSPEPLLRAPFWVADRLRWIPAIQRVAVLLLNQRFAIMSWRGAVREAGSWEALRQEFGMRLPVLLYHHVGDPQPNTYASLTISPRRFERHVRWLAGRGYTGIRPSDWLQWCHTGTRLPDKPVLLTFDDAYADLTENAFPVLRRSGFGAAVFVVTGHVGGTNAWDEANGSGTHRLMTAEQIRFWSAQGIEFGAHSRMHTDLTALAGAELVAEVAGSRDELSAILGTPVVSFAYPYGRHNQAVLDSVRGTFDLAFGSEQGLNDFKTDPHLLRRSEVSPSDSVISLAWRVRFGGSPIQRLRARIRLRSRFAGEALSAPGPGN